MSAQQRIHLNPNAPRAPMMPSMGGGYQPDPIGRRSSPGHVGGRSENELLGQVQQWSSKVEDVIEAYTQVRGSLHSYSALRSSRDLVGVNEE